MLVSQPYSLKQEKKKKEILKTFDSPLNTPHLTLSKVTESFSYNCFVAEILPDKKKKSKRTGTLSGNTSSI